MQHETNFETTRFYGGGYSPEQDHDRLTGQLRKVFDYMASSHKIPECWVSLRQISDYTGVPESSASAKLRTLRNEHGFIIDKMRKKHGSGLWVYRLKGRGEIPEKRKSRQQLESEIGELKKALRTIAMTTGEERTLQIANGVLS